MVRSSKWDIERCRPVALRLSERDPVRGMVNAYARPCDVSFDMHYELELGIVCRGRMRRRYRDWQATLGPGEAWLCGMWEPHAGRVLRAPCECAVLIAYPQMLAGFRCEEAPAIRWSAPFAAPPAERPRVGMKQRPEMLDLVSRLRRVVGLPDGPEKHIRMRLLLIEALMLLRRGWPAPPADEPDAGEGFVRVNRAIRMVFDSRRPIDTAEAARACAMSRSHFDRLFARYMGISFAKFELRHRLHGAAGQILRTDDPIKAVAASWGFIDSSHLHRRFLEYYARSPKEYRERSE